MYFSRVYVGLIMFQVSLLLIGQQGLVNFFRYRSLLPIGWRIVLVHILRQRRRKTTNTAPPSCTPSPLLSSSTPPSPLFSCSSSSYSSLPCPLTLRPLVLFPRPLLFLLLHSSFFSLLISLSLLSLLCPVLLFSAWEGKRRGGGYYKDD